MQNNYLTPSDYHLTSSVWTGQFLFTVNQVLHNSEDARCCELTRDLKRVFKKSLFTERQTFSQSLHLRKSSSILCKTNLPPLHTTTTAYEFSPLNWCSTFSWHAFHLYKLCLQCVSIKVEMTRWHQDHVLWPVFYNSLQTLLLHVQMFVHHNKTWQYCSCQMVLKTNIHNSFWAQQKHRSTVTSILLLTYKM